MPATVAQTVMHGSEPHPIVFGRSHDGHQNPVCRSCGETLDGKEFQAAQAAGLVVC